MNKPFYGVATMPNSQRAPLITPYDAPGPGTYDCNKERKLHELPKYSLSPKLQHGSCFQNNSITPGPGVYEIESSIKHLPQNKFLFKEQKYKPFMEKTYSQNNLHLPGALNIKGGFSFGYREVVRQIQKSPGPVYYLNESTQLKRKTKIQNSHRGFGYGDRNKMYCKENTPGPGSFQCQVKQAKSGKAGWSFGSGKRQNSVQKQGLGPGQYEPQSYNLVRSFKLRGRREDRVKVQSNTGPGSYDLPDTKNRVGTRFRPPQDSNSADQQGNQSSISPFDYNPPRCFDRPSGRGCTLGSKLNSTNPDQGNPGPGSYQLNSQDFLKKNGSYMGRKLQQHKKENTMDNFYKYTPQMNNMPRGAPKFSFPQAKRGEQPQSSLKKARGQDFHQSLDIKSGGYSYSIGNGKRFNQFKKEPNLMKQQAAMYSTIGCMPTYLRKKQRD